MLKVDNISYSVGNFSLKNFSLELHKGEYCGLMGGSGSGKSILLELICGLREVESGDIICNGSIGILFQDYALFPSMSVFDNIAYPLRCKREEKNEIKSKVDTIAQDFSISPLLKRYPDSLSGGEKQRVALARTLIIRPDLLLLDEPLSALDASLRAESLKMLKELSALGFTILHVSHDIQELSVNADRIVNI